jgi:hypothetical protein
MFIVIGFKDMKMIELAKDHFRCLVLLLVALSNVKSGFAWLQPASFK